MWINLLFQVSTYCVWTRIFFTCLRYSAQIERTITTLRTCFELIASKNFPKYSKQKKHGFKKKPTTNPNVFTSISSYNNTFNWSQQFSNIYKKALQLLHRPSRPPQGIQFSLLSLMFETKIYQNLKKIYIF